jgi:hypothetical protein
MPTRVPSVAAVASCERLGPVNGVTRPGVSPDGSGRTRRVEHGVDGQPTRGPDRGTVGTLPPSSSGAYRHDFPLKNGTSPVQDHATRGVARSLRDLRPACWLTCDRCAALSAASSQSSLTEILWPGRSNLRHPSDTIGGLISRSKIRPGWYGSSAYLGIRLRCAAALITPTAVSAKRTTHGYSVHR